MSSLLDEMAIAQELTRTPGWHRAGAAIVRSYRFPSFDDAMNFANRVAAWAEEMDHHPDILIQYRTVTLKCSTHSAGGLTGQDFNLARRVDQAVAVS